MTEYTFDANVQALPSLEINYYPDYNQVVILADDRALRYLQTLIQELIDSQSSGQHYHIDKTGYLEGNINDMVIERKA